MKANISLCAALLLSMGAVLLQADRVEGSFDRNLKVTGATQIDVHTGSGSITVRKGAAGEVRIHAKIVANSMFGDNTATVREIEKNPPVKQNGNSIVIGEEWRNAWNNVSISYELTTPEDTQLNARTGSGSIDVASVRGSVDSSTGSGTITTDSTGSTVKARTGSGGITIRHAGGDVTANTGSGHVEVSDVKGSVDAHAASGGVTVIGATGSVRAKSSSGRVRVEKAVADVEAHSASGGVEVDGSPKSSHWDIQSSSGGVRVSLPTGTAFELDARTASGRISTTHPLTVSGTIGRNSLHGVAIRPDNHIQIRASSGNVSVD